MGIKHIEDIKPEVLLEFLELWDKQKDQITITEKIDGNSFSLGKENGVFYIKTKNKKYFSVAEMPDVYYFDEFKRYYETFSKIEYKDNDFELIGEMIPVYDHNVIIYDKDKINNGIFVIFQNDNKTKSIINTINKQSDIKVYLVPVINCDIKINNAFLTKVQEITKQEVIYKPAKSIENKQIKDKFLNSVREIGLEIKSLFLKQMPKSYFGNECEGLVISFNDQKFKIVDKELFLKRKNNDWYFINEVKKIEKNIHNDLNLNLDNLNKLEIECENYKFYSNSKRIESKNKIILCKEQIKDIIKEKISINENNVINSYVDREFIEPTIKNLFNYLGLKFDNKRIKIVGNNRNKICGDIDLAIDKNYLKESLNLSEDNFWINLEEFLKHKNVSYKIIKNFKQFHIVTPLSTKNYEHLNAINSKGLKEKELGYIQLDFFVGDLDWITNIMSSSPLESNYKALYRNLLLISMFSNILIDSKQDKDMKYKVVFDTKDGLRITKRKIIKNKNNKDKLVKLEDRLYTSNPNMIPKFLFKGVSSWEDINSFEKLYKFYQSDSFKYQSFTKNIDKEFIHTLNVLKKKIPKELIYK